MIDVTQRVEFECLYFFLDDDGYTRLNPKRYKLEVTVSCPERNSKNGCTITFESLRKYLQGCVPDGGFVYNNLPNGLSQLSSSFCELIKLHPIPIYAITGPVCAESLLQRSVSLLELAFSQTEPGVTITSARLYESSTSYVSYTPASL